MEQRPIVFPKDEQKHDSTTEWWYFNGHLKDSSGHKYSYMNTLFKIKFPKVYGGMMSFIPSRELYFCHSIITDIDNNKHYPNIEQRLKINDNSAELLDINFFSIANNRNYFIFQKDKTNYEICGKDIELTLSNKKTPILVGGKGFVDNVGEETFYYSLPDLQTKGSLLIKGKEVAVTGTSWMDHQWGDFGIPKGYWNWFSIQLHGDIQMVCYQVGNEISSHCLATISDADGHQKTYNKIEIISTKEIWKSPKSGVAYPLGWQIKIPEAGIVIDTRAFVKDHEIIFHGVNYWEGPIDIKAKIKTKSFTGVGYQELVGTKGR